VLRGPRTLFTQHIQDFSCDAKVLWAPDGKAFALNYSDGGAIGGFHVLVFSIQGDRISNISKAIKPAVDHFKARHCTIGEFKIPIKIPKSFIKFSRQQDSGFLIYIT